MLLSPGDGPADAGRPGLRARFADWRRDFRPWRRQRPFVGGVLLVLAGLEMLFLRGPIGLDQLGVNVVLRFGVEGAQATILPLVLILLGILVIAQPVHRVFYGVIALAISVYSIAGVNLGGWVVGFLLGVVGGVIVVSWGPEEADAGTAEEDGTKEEPGGEASVSASDGAVVPASGAGKTGTPRSAVGPEPDDAPREPARDAEPTPEPAVGAEPAPAEPAPAEPAPDAEPAADTQAVPKADTLSSALRALSQKSAAVVVAGAMAAGGMSLPASSTQTAQDDSFWCVVFGACDDGDAEPSASPTPSPGATGDQGDEAEDPVGDAVDDLTGGATDPADGGSGDDAGTGSDDAAGGKDEDDKSECQEPTQDGETPPDAGPDAKTDPCGEIDPQATIEEALHTELGTCVKVTFGGKFDLNVDLPGQCGSKEDGSVFSLPADLESRDLTIPLDGINGIGLANVPVKNDGSRRDAIKISADKVVVDGFWLKSYAYDKGTVAGTDTRASFVSLEGDAHMYVSSIHANLPDGQDLLEVATKVLEGASLIEILLTATDARMGFLGATSDLQVWDTFREQVWGDPEHPIGQGPRAGDA
ncbi:DUF6114 domain-containing protein [Promicromonospora sukumoe]|uniref:DUF6114 domain-containing protein n=1 Tax=Promicromonospora sukumoe TaxID=88382 RepID=UPI0036502D6D